MLLPRVLLCVFYRNAFNIGLPLLTADTDKIDEGDELEVDLEKGMIRNLTKGIELKSTSILLFMMQLLKDGGIVEHIKKHGDFKVD